MSTFRSDYLSYEAITQTLRGWTEKYPKLVRLQAIGKSTEGRELWVLTIGPDPDRARPAAWVDGNMHATELAGSSVALSIAEDVLSLHTGAKTIHDLPEHVCDRLRETLFYVMPRMCPDGAESVLREGRYVRSNPRDRRLHAPTPRWVAADVDGDGLSLLIRKEDACGEFVESSEAPGVLLPRRVEDPPPYYKVYPEGMIENFDGHIPDPYFLSDNDVDLNRNFPFSWAPEPEQIGAGSFPASEPESRAVVEFATAHPNMFAWLNLHTFGGVYIRPLGHAPDSKMDPDDLSLFRQVAEWGQEHGGYPTVSGFHEFLYEPDKPLHGDLSDFGYHQRGCLSFVCELWDLFRVIGMDVKKPFVDHYSHLTRKDMLAFAKWDRENNKSRVFRGWKKTKHPQLGEVEVGGVDTRVGLSNPSYEMLGDICAKQSKFFLRIAATAPSIRVSHVRTIPLGANASRVEVAIENIGYLPTYVLSSAKKLDLDARVFAEAEGVEIASKHRVEIGHLEGWGRGLYGFGSSIFYQRSRGSGMRKVIAFTVKGHGTLRVRAHGLRVGSAHTEISVP